MIIISLVLQSRTALMFHLIRKINRLIQRKKLHKYTTTRTLTLSPHTKPRFHRLKMYTTCTLRVTVQQTSKQSTKSKPSTSKPHHTTQLLQVLSSTPLQEPHSTRWTRIPHYATTTRHNHRTANKSPLFLELIGSRITRNWRDSSPITNRRTRGARRRFKSSNSSYKPRRINSTDKRTRGSRKTCISTNRERRKEKICRAIRLELRRLRWRGNSSQLESQGLFELLLLDVLVLLFIIKWFKIIYFN